MLEKIRKELGHQGLCRVLLDSLSLEDLNQLASECGLDTGMDVPAESKALTLARFVSSSPQLAVEVSRLLDRTSADLNDYIARVSDEDLLRDFSPQSMQFDIPPGRVIWALFHCEQRSACRKLLKVWMDFIDPHSTEPPGGDESTQFTETMLFDSEKQAVDSLSEELEETPELSQEAVQQELSQIARYEMPSEIQRPSSAESFKILEEEEEEFSLSLEIKESLDKILRKLEILQQWVQYLDQRFDYLDEAIKPIQEQLIKSKEADTHIGLKPEPSQEEARLGKEKEIFKTEDTISTTAETVMLEDEETAPPPQPEEEAPDMALVAFDESERTMQDEQGDHPQEAPPEGMEEPEPDSQEMVPAPESKNEAKIKASKPPQAVKPPREAVTPESVIRERADPVAVQKALDKLRQRSREMPGIPDGILRNELIVLVGGFDHLAGDYRTLIERMGGRIERYPSVDEYSISWLEDLTDRAFMIIILGNVVAQPGVYRLLEIANRLGSRLYIHHSTAPASLHRFLQRLVETDAL